MKNYYIVENGYYKISKKIEAKNKEEAIKKYKEWLDDEFYSEYINLESNDTEVIETDD